MSANLVGQTLLNRFYVEEFIDVGGMGTVYRVWDRKMNVYLAMKVLHADLADDPSVLKLFDREANALKKLAHPNIVPFYGIPKDADPPFLLERFIDGPSLKDILKERRPQPLPVEEALIYLKALCAALGYAHVHGVVHCDVKPGNVMVDKGGNIYLTDFGIARHADSTTTTIAGAGTAEYMAPEQIRGEAVSAATDIYALGVVLFEMLTGRKPFLGDEKGTESAGQTKNERIRYAHLMTPPPNPRAYNAGIPESLAQVILKALEKDPERRYASTQELLFACCEALGISPTSLPDRIEVRGSKHEDDIHTHGISKSKLLRMLSAVGVVVIILIALVVLDWIDIIKLPYINIGRSPSATPTSTLATANSPLIEITPLRPTSTPTEVLPTASRTVVRPTATRFPTFTPVPAKPRLLADKNYFCRQSPTQYSEAHWTFKQGDSALLLGRAENNWWLISVSDPSTRTKCCWVGGGATSGNIKILPFIDYEIDRMNCPQLP